MPLGKLSKMQIAKGFEVSDFKKVNCINFESTRNFREGFTAKNNGKFSIFSTAKSIFIDSFIQCLWDEIAGLQLDGLFKGGGGRRPSSNLINPQ